MVIASYLLDKAREKGYKQGYAEGYTDGYAEGYAEGYAKGYAQGLAEVRANVAKQNEAYYKRMIEAREKGEDFNEPPPTFNRNRQ